jgi:hypothetical protein
MLCGAAVVRREVLGSLAGSHVLYICAVFLAAHLMTVRLVSSSVEATNRCHAYGLKPGAGVISLSTSKSIPPQRGGSSAPRPTVRVVNSMDSPRHDGSKRRRMSIS